MIDFECYKIVCELLSKKNKKQWIESNTVCIHWNGKHYIVNKYHEETGDIAEHKFLFEELELAVKVFFKLVSEDRITKTDDEVMGKK